ncbi:MAG: cytochrome C [Planctomycetes bacterium]|nr:cytochrome C [Planctomycetota bacterium]
MGLIFLVGFFTWLAFRRMVENDRRVAGGRPTLEEEESRDKVLVWPDLVYIEFIALILCTVLFIAWSVGIGAPLEQPANFTKTPNPSKAPWYFLGLQEMLVYFDPWLAGVVFPGLIIVGLMAIPYFDPNPRGNGYYSFRERPFAIVVFCFGFIIMWVVLIVMGTFLRGPNWNFFGPYEYWDPHKLEPLLNVNLSEYFWVKGYPLSVGLPEGYLLREAPGFALLAAYFVLGPLVLARTFFRRMLEQMGMARYQVMCFLFLMMTLLPLKMTLRWSINLKYFIAIPEKFFNI